MSEDLWRLTRLLRAADSCQMLRSRSVTCGHCRASLNQAVWVWPRWGFTRDCTIYGAIVQAPCTSSWNPHACINEFTSYPQKHQTESFLHHKCCDRSKTPTVCHFSPWLPWKPLIDYTGYIWGLFWRQYALAPLFLEGYGPVFQPLIKCIIWSIYSPIQMSLICLFS